MYKAIAEKWVEALRSGEYQQGRLVLQNSRGAFCCLGVLCDLHRTDEGGEWVTDHVGRTDGGKLYQPLLGGEDYALLPPAVQRWAGIRSNNPAARGEILTDLNDDGRSFDDLADLIDTRWEEL